MKKNLRKLSALLLALVMVLGMTGMAFAAVDEDLGSYEGSNNKGWGVTSGAIPVTKSIMIFNPDNAEVREPDLKFEYAVTPVTDPALLGTITDDGRYNEIGSPAVKTPVTVKVNAGVANSVTGATITFDKTATVTAKATGTEKERSGNLTVDISKFDHAGVYRYLITETVKGATTNATVTDLSTYGLEARTSDYDATRYLDIYIINGTSGLELSSAVIFKVNTVDDTSKAATTGITTTTDKTTGFEPGTPASGSGDPDYTNDTEVDRYFTYNIKVGKTTTGTLADKSNDFPFVITLDGADTLVPTVVTDYSKSGATYEGTEPTTVNITTGTVALTPKMSNGDYIELKGIPKGTTVTVKETNNTPDIYTASWDAVAGTTSPAVTAISNNTPNTDLNLANGKYAETSAAVAIDGGQTVTSGTIGGTYVKTVLGFTNNLAEISPTGVVLRVAPYIAILCGGIVLLVLTKKRKADEEA